MGTKIEKCLHCHSRPDREYSLFSMKKGEESPSLALRYSLPLRAGAQSPPPQRPCFSMALKFYRSYSIQNYLQQMSSVNFISGKYFSSIVATFSYNPLISGPYLSTSNISKPENCFEGNFKEHE